MREKEEEPAKVLIPEGSLLLFEAMIYELFETYTDLFTRRRVEARQEVLRRSSTDQTSYGLDSDANKGFRLSED